MEPYYRWQRSYGERMTSFTSEDRENAGRLVDEAPYHPGYEDAAMKMSDKGYEEAT